LVKSDNLSYPFVFNLHDPIKPLRILPKLLAQTVRLTELFVVERIAQKFKSLPRVYRATSQTDDRQTDNKRVGSCHKPNVT